MPPQMPRLVHRAHSRSSCGHSTVSETPVIVPPMSVETATMVHPHNALSEEAGAAALDGSAHAVAGRAQISAEAIANVRRRRGQLGIGHNPIVAYSWSESSPFCSVRDPV